MPVPFPLNTVHWLARWLPALLLVAGDDDDDDDNDDNDDDALLAPVTTTAATPSAAAAAGFGAAQRLHRDESDARQLEVVWPLAALMGAPAAMQNAQYSVSNSSMAGLTANATAARSALVAAAAAAAAAGTPPTETVPATAAPAGSPFDTPLEAPVRLTESRVATGVEGSVAGDRLLDRPC